MPEPTISAVGVARPSVQGQAMKQHGDGGQDDQLLVTLAFHSSPGAGLRLRSEREKLGDDPLIGCLNTHAFPFRLLVVLSAARYRIGAAAGGCECLERKRRLPGGFLLDALPGLALRQRG